MPELTTADTSRMAYEKILASLPRIYKKICEVLSSHRAGLTSLEIDRCTGDTIESDKRMAEMLRQDLVMETGVRECSVSGREAMTYMATGRPRKMDNKKQATRPSKRMMETQLTLLNQMALSPPLSSAERGTLHAMISVLSWVLGHTDKPPRC